MVGVISLGSRHLAQSQAKTQTGCVMPLAKFFGLMIRRSWPALSRLDMGRANERAAMARRDSALYRCLHRHGGLDRLPVFLSITYPLNLPALMRAFFCLQLEQTANPPESLYNAPRTRARNKWTRTRANPLTPLLRHPVRLHLHIPHQWSHPR